MAEGIDGMAALSEYELQRMQTIQANKEKLHELGLDVSMPEPPKTGQAKRERRHREARAPTRQSKRVRSVAPDYTGVKIDEFGDDEPKLFRSIRTSAHEGDEPDVDDPEASQKAKERAAAEVREAALAWAASCKERAEAGDRDAKDADQWRAEAIKRWGEKAGLADTDDWEAYVKSRTATPPPLSPTQLMQERYMTEPWKMLICCALMIRCSSEVVKTRCIEGFFRAYPTPSDALDASPSAMETIVKPLGLFYESRYQAIVNISKRFLEMPVFELAEKGENKVVGAGPFTVHSYFLFCKDDHTIEPTDKVLVNYIRWRRAVAVAAATLVD